MNKVLQFIDKYIDKIPVHIRDIIQKAFIMLAAVAGVVAIAYGIKMGAAAAKPGGKQLFEDVSDMFYKEQIIEENKKQNELEMLPLDFNSQEMPSGIEGESVPGYMNEQENEGFVTSPEEFELGDDPYRNTDDTKFEETDNEIVPELPQTDSGKMEDVEIPDPDTKMIQEPDVRPERNIEPATETIPNSDSMEKAPETTSTPQAESNGEMNGNNFIETDE